MMSDSTNRRHEDHEDYNDGPSIQMESMVEELKLDLAKMQESVTSITVNKEKEFAIQEEYGKSAETLRYNPENEEDENIEPSFVLENISQSNQSPPKQNNKNNQGAVRVINTNEVVTRKLPLETCDNKMQTQ